MKTTNTNTVKKEGVGEGPTPGTALPWKPGIIEPTAICNEGGFVIYRGKPSFKEADVIYICHAANLYPEMLSWIESMVRKGECTCIDGGPDFTCDVCEGKLLLTKAAVSGRGEA